MRLYISGPMAGHPDNNHAAFDAMAKQLREAGHEVISPAETSRLEWQMWGGKDQLEKQLPPESPQFRAHFLKIDVNSLLQVEAVVVLPYWYLSRGATFECLIAKQLGMPIYAWMPKHGDNGSDFYNLSSTVAQLALKHAETEMKATGKPISIEGGAIHIGTSSGVKKGDPDESIALEADRLVDGARQKDYGHPLDNYDKVAKLWNAYLAGVIGPLPAGLQAEQVIDMMTLMKIGRLMNGAHRDSIVDIAGYAKCRDMCRTERKRRGA